LLAAIGSSLAEFEALRLGPELRQLVAISAGFGDSRWAWNPAPLPPLPLVASSFGGEWGGTGSQVEVTEIRPRDLLERLSRPLSLAHDPDGFALTVVGASMWPRFRTHSRLAISPRSTVAVGDDVLVRLRSPRRTELNGIERALIMHLVKRTAGRFHLRQFNPDLTIQVDGEQVDAVLKIAGELI
jgi:hypothetical protein